MEGVDEPKKLATSGVDSGVDGAVELVVSEDEGESMIGATGDCGTGDRSSGESESILGRPGVGGGCIASSILTSLSMFRAMLLEPSDVSIPSTLAPPSFFLPFPLFFASPFATSSPSLSSTGIKPPAANSPSLLELLIPKDLFLPPCSNICCCPSACFNTCLLSSATASLSSSFLSLRAWRTANRAPNPLTDARRPHSPTPMAFSKSLSW